MEQEKDREKEQEQKQKQEVKTPKEKRSIKRRRCYTPEPPSSKPSVEVDRPKTSIRRRRRIPDGPEKVKAKLCTLRRAEELQSSLDPKAPSFLKYMIRSHVASCFWMALPLHFCKLYLPKKDTLMTLVDTNDEEYHIKFLIDNPALSGGWRAFSLAHHLNEGDVLVFHLIEPTKFKVYIVRTDLLSDDGGVQPIDFDASAKQEPSPLDNNASEKQDPVPSDTIVSPKEDQEPSADKDIKHTKKPGSKRKVDEHDASNGIKDKNIKSTKKLARQNSLSSPIGQGNNQNGSNLGVPTGQGQNSLQSPSHEGKTHNSLILRLPAGQGQNRVPSPNFQGKSQSSLDLVVPTGRNGNDPETVVDLKVSVAVKSPGSCTEFKDMKSLESFTIKVNDSTIDSEISEHTRTKYYELCCTQNAFLHENLVDRINSKLVAGIISETVNIADAIKASNLTTSRDEFTTWGKSLIAFEHMGMNVGFLRARLQRLVTIAFESELSKYTERFKDAIVEHAHTEEEIKNIEAKLVVLKETCKRLDAETEILKVKAEEHEQEYEAEVNEPW